MDVLVGTPHVGRVLGLGLGLSPPVGLSWARCPGSPGSSAVGSSLCSPDVPPAAGMRWEGQNPACALWSLQGMGDPEEKMHGGCWGQEE